MFRYKELSTLRKLILFKKLIASSIKVVSGAIASFVTKAAGKAISVLDSIEPIQDLHGYDKPWSGGNGKNLLNIPDIAETTNRGVTYSVKDGVLKINGTCTAGVGIFYASLSLPSDTYAISVNLVSGSTGGANNSFNFYTSDETRYLAAFGTTSYPATRTFSSDVSRCDIVINANATFSNAVLTFQIEKGSSATSWEPYSNICPISGHTEVVTSRAGKNLLNPSLYKFQTTVRNGLTYTVNNDGSISVTGTVTATGGPVLTDYFYLPAGTYSFIEEASQNVHCAYRRIPSGQSSSVSLSSPFTTDGNDRIYINLYSKVSSGNIDLTIHPQIEADSTATAYEPYNGTSYTTDLGQTVYGGTLDVVSGVLTVDRAIFQANTSTMNNSEAYPGWRPAGVRENGAKGGTFNNGITNVGSGYSVNVNNTNDIIYLPTQLYEGRTQSEWISMAIDVQILYELATPQTIQLTPQEVELLKGQNNLWCDSGEIQVTYKG